jgi:NADPH-dependent 2,4-dienoyl-CoA reductase/sulfur reductase-like enzyme
MYKPFDNPGFVGQSEPLVLMRDDQTEHASRKRVLILGGGFAGLAVAMELEKKLAHDLSVEITLINRENFFLFTPMLHEAATAISQRL